MVLAENVWDSLFSTDKLQVHVTEFTTDVIDADALKTDAAEEIADQVWDEATADHASAGTTGKALTDAGTADATAANQTTMITHLTDIKGTGFVKDTDSLVDLTHISAGAGGVEFTYTVTSGGNPLADVTVWVTTDEAGTNIVASGLTDVSGEVVFYLDAATYYMWSQKVGYNFTNPDENVVS
jgi:hypothetical protein